MPSRQMFRSLCRRRFVFEKKVTKILKSKKNCPIHLEQLDVADENGECKFLFRNPESYVSQHISEREKLILLRVEDPQPGERLANNCKFIPLLKSLEDDKDFYGVLNPAAGHNKKTKASTKLGIKKAMASTSSPNGSTVASPSIPPTPGRRMSVKPS